MKKILLINVKVIGENSGTGNTLKNLFLEYPSNCLFQLCLDNKRNENSNTIPNTIYTGNESYPVDWFLRKILGPFQKNNSNTGKSELPSAINNQNIKGKLHDFIRGLMDMSFISINNKVLQTIDNFKPDVIYTCGTSIRNFKVVNFFSRRYSIKSVIHIMDDWPETTYTTSSLSICAKKVLERNFNQAISNSVINFGISDELALKYEQKYNKRFYSLMNPVKNIVSEYKPKSRKQKKIIYAGALSLNRWKSIIQVAEIVNALNEDMGECFEFEIYIPSSNRSKDYFKIIRDLNVTIHDYVPIDKIQDVYENSDILLHVESFDTNIIPFTKYSLSTKIPEYMAAGKPILAYLPVELYGYRYIQERKIGLASSSKEELVKCLKEIIYDNQLVKELALNGLAFAQKEHSTQIVNKKLEEAFEAACIDRY